MKISQLIEQLKAIEEKHGDISVFAWPYDGQFDNFEPQLEVGRHGTRTVLEIDATQPKE